MTMEHYTPAQWTLIDMANHFGLDKEVYKKRLAFGREMLEAIKEGQDMSQWIKKADAPAMFTKAICAVRDILEGNPTGHVIELDACNSGPAILSALMHCETGMRNTGLIDTGVRPDGYSTIKENFSSEVDVTRKEVKTATVPYAYGSDFKPEQVFGGELFAEFEAAYEKTFPEAYFVRKVLINAWDSKALFHEFTAIDGLVAHLECRGIQKTRGTLMGYTYTYTHTVNRPLIPMKDQGTKSLVANVTHCADGFVVREFDNRCNYNVRQVTNAVEMIDRHLAHGSDYEDEDFLRLQALGLRHNFVSMAVVEVLDWDCLAGAEPEYLMKLRALFESVLEYPSFETFTIH
ncbi:RNA polymerase [Vibrio phage D292]